MFLYHLRLAKLSLMKQPLLTALMIGAIGIGVGVCMTVLSFVYVMSGDPIPEKSDELFAVRLDSWDPENPYFDDKPEEAPWQLTQKDAEALMESTIPTHHAAMRKAVFTAVPENTDIAPFLTRTRMTTRDFFALFNVPFQYGGTWSEGADTNAEDAVVLSKESNETLFGGENSVGREVQMGEFTFTVTGVLAEWRPVVSYWDVNNGNLEEPPAAYMPFSIVRSRETDLSGNTNCWKDETIDSYESYLNSECVTVQFWAELNTKQQRAEYQSWLDAYTTEQKRLGRFERPTNNRLSDVNEWLRIREVVSSTEWGVLSIAVLFLIACLVNTIGLILARFVAKAPVIGLRRALGASKAQIFRQHLVEVGLVGFAGGLLGIVLAYAGLVGLRTLIDDLEFVARLNPELMLITIAIAIFSAIIAGLYPTWRVCQMAPANYLKTQ